MHLNIVLSNNDDILTLLKILSKWLWALRPQHLTKRKGNTSLVNNNKNRIESKFQSQKFWAPLCDISVGDLLMAKTLGMMAKTLGISRRLPSVRFMASVQKKPAEFDGEISELYTRISGAFEKLGPHT